MFKTHFDHSADGVDAQNAILHFQLSASSILGLPAMKLSAAQRWAQLAHKTDQSQILEAYHTIIHLISQVAGLEKPVQNRYTNLINISELSSSAAAAAIDLGRHDLALEWLEQGCCLVWNQLNDLHTPIDGLHEHNPTLANDIVRVSMALQNAASRTESTAYMEETNMATKTSLQEQAHTHIKLAQEWEQLLIKVRTIPQFADFLCPASCSTILKNIPNSGHVIVVNVHKDRSDAILLTSGTEEALHIALPEFSYNMAAALRRDLKILLHNSRIRIRGDENDASRGSRSYMQGIADILRQLWTFVVKPILDGLGYFVPASNLPRIWWCATGPLAFLPIHAAGIYTASKSTPGTYTTLPDFEISSYTPTVLSLVKKNQNLQEINPEKVGLLMVSQPDTPELPCIPGTALEVGTIRQLLTEHQIQYLTLESGDAEVDRVKEQMDSYSCIHFACHASQNTTMPLQSGFFLYNGQLELSEIIKKRIVGADLAFLSACQTSTGDEKLSEEAVHLAGGMLAAGYRGVVATMWSIKDSFGPKFAEEFYKNLLSYEADRNIDSKRLSADGAAHALHYSTLQIRKTLDNSETSLLTWVPYVHFGI
ncbi:hypothetical protein CVT25_012837 [Psilocybe cyanescens]|uniref:CHAT domain-containing protein n=1 Tax=Psilocybe cyanescens TaxID=93625 RepID=A0A409VR93_PSICY|nr:hypothetical protein CVT25_012837 [Psilocybe cyanescens]